MMTDIVAEMDSSTVHPECEVIFEGEEDRLGTIYKDCTKNPGHKSFIPVSEFQMDYLPKERQTQELFDYIKARSNLTVRIIVRYTSKERPPKFADIDAPYPYVRLRGSSRCVRYGTGSIIYITPEAESLKGESCPCHECKKSDEPEKEFWKAIVRTATHVIFDDSEAALATLDCFYDSDENKDEVVKNLYGCRVLKYTNKAMDTYLSDMCHLECFTHDRDLVKKLEPWFSFIEQDFAEPDHEKPLGIMISHPHGCSKRITLGNVWHLTYPLIQNYPDMEATKCRLPLFPWSKYSMDHEGMNTIPPFTKVSSEVSESSDSLAIKASTETETNQFAPCPGTEFPLPDDMVISFPDNPAYALRYTYHHPNWFTLPSGTKFTLADGSDVFFPPEAEFFDNGCVSGCCYLTYDTDTCPGSSGAITPECEVVLEGDTLDHNLINEECRKNPGHQSFISMSDFTMEHFPPPYQSKENMDVIQLWNDLTVKILVRFISNDRPLTYIDCNEPYPYSKFRGSYRIKRYGTGIINSLVNEDRSIKDEPCPCHLCEKSDDPEREHWVIFVQTAAHVIFDDSEAKRSVFECFYNSEDRKEVKLLYGIRVWKRVSNNLHRTDLCDVVCVTHDIELVRRLQSFRKKKGRNLSHITSSDPSDLKPGILISHPHGFSKKITLGRIISFTVPIGPKFPSSTKIQFSIGARCRLPLLPWSKSAEVSENDNDKYSLTKANSSHYSLDNPKWSEKEKQKPTLDLSSANDNEERNSLVPSPVLPDNMEKHPNPNSQSTHSKDEMDISKSSVDEESGNELFCPEKNMPLLPGAEYLLPSSMTFTLPEGAEFAFKFLPHYLGWFHFPSGTTFTLSDGKQVHIPKDADFFSYEFSSQLCYANYDTDSCPGTSGACLIHDMGGSQSSIENYPHMGHSKDGTNRSGLQHCDLIMKLSNSDALGDLIKTVTD